MKPSDSKYDLDIKPTEKWKLEGLKSVISKRCASKIWGVSVSSDLKKIDFFTFETSESHLIRNFLRKGRLRVKKWRHILETCPNYIEILDQISEKTFCFFPQIKNFLIYPTMVCNVFYSLNWKFSEFCLIRRLYQPKSYIVCTFGKNKHKRPSHIF